MPLGSMTLARAEVEIGGNDTDLQNTLARASRSMEKTGRRMSRLGQQMSVAITAPLVAAGSAAVKLAADAEETRNLFNVAMGDMADDARAFAEARAEALSLDPVGFQQTMAVFQQMFGSMGIAEEQALDMSKALSQLQVDMSSFFNLPMEEALQKLQSGIAGEIEPLRRLGVNVSQAKIEMVALREGMIEAGEEMTEQQKIQARFITIMEQLENAHGDFEGTSGSLTNTLRQLKEQSRVMAREFGEILIPVAKDLADTAKSVIEFFKDLPQPMQVTIVKVAALTAAIGPLLFVTGQLITSVRTLAGAFVALRAAQIGSAVAGWASAFASLALEVRSLSGALALLQAAMGPAGWLTLGLTAVVGFAVKQKFDEWGDAARRAAEKMESLKDSLDGLVRKSKELTRAQVEQVVTSLSVGIAGIEAQIESKQAELARLSNLPQSSGGRFGIGGGAGRVGEIRREIDELKARAAEFRRTVDRLTAGIRSAATEMESGVAEGAGSVADSTNQATRSLRGLQSVMATAREVAAGFGISIGPIPDLLGGVADQARHSFERMRDLTAAMLRVRQENEQIKLQADRRVAELASNIELARIQDELARTRDAARDLASSMTDAFMSIVDGSKSFAQAITDMVQSIIADLTRAIIQKQIFDAVFGLLGGGIPDAPPPIDPPTPPSFAGGFQHGGTIPRGSFGLVGERGPELVSGPATVTPMSKGGGNQPVTVNQEINFNVTAMDGRSVQQALKQQKGTIMQIVGEAAGQSTSFRKQLIVGR